MQSHPKIAELETAEIRHDLARVMPGATVRVHYRIREGEKERVQVFQGVVIGKRRAGARSSFTVRKISFGVGVERVFVAHSPFISEIEVMSQGVIRRSKLYFLRKLSGKKARIKTRRES
ncbi:MAG: 50S ribosomal protein L19 [Polyangiaceae bacterium]|nr:50S ribosomal protein L19 [Polyangiaceae bacterium]